MSNRGRLRFTGELRELPTRSADVSQAVMGAMRKAVLFAQALWWQRAQDLGIRRTGAYLQGVQGATIRTVQEDVSDTAISTVYDIVNTAPHAKIVEDGHVAFSLAKAIDWSSRNGRVKMGKNGPYLHIAFAHAAFQSPSERARSGMTMGTLKTMMPPDVSASASKLRQTIPLRQGPIRSTASGTSQFVAADRYTPGSRLKDTASGPRFVAGGVGGTVDVWRSERAVAGRDVGGKRLTNPAWKRSRYQGLMRSGPKGHSTFMTVRTLTPRSVGWNIPAQAGYGVARQVASALNGGVGHDRFRALLIGSITDALGLQRGPG